MALFLLLFPATVSSFHYHASHHHPKCCALTYHCTLSFHCNICYVSVFPSIRLCRVNMLLKHLPQHLGIEMNEWISRWPAGRMNGNMIFEPLSCFNDCLSFCVVRLEKVKCDYGADETQICNVGFYLASIFSNK